MALMMDSLGGSGPLKADRATALCFARERLSLHGLDADTSRIINGPDIQVFEPEYERQFLTPSSSAFSSYSHSPQSSSDDACVCGSDMVGYGDTAAPGPTSCVFLEKELKRLYAKEDFDILESLGEGFFGDVYKVRHRLTGEVLVLKVGKDRERENRPRVKASVLKEVAVLNQLTQHPNILSFRGVCVDVDPKEGVWNLHILVDYCDGGSLSRLICDTQKVFPWRLRCSLARDISCAMKYVHSKNIMHRDLTSMNVLLQTAAHGTKAVVADFGLSCRIPDRDDRLVQVGTPYWMAPECLKEEFYDQMADVFSFGIIMCQMIARIDADPEAGMYRTNSFGLDYIRFLAHCPMDTPLELLKLAFQCVVMDPSQRPSFERIFERLEEFVLSYCRESDNMNTLRVETSFADSRLGRSLSDAALKSTNSFKQKPSAFNTPTSERRQDVKPPESLLQITGRRPAILIEGIPLSVDQSKTDEESKIKSRMEELARSVAVEEVQTGEETSESGNPFICHEVYSTTRKLALPEMMSVRRRGSSISDRVRDRGYTHSVGTDPFAELQKDQADSTLNQKPATQFDEADTRLAELCRRGGRRVRRSVSMPCTPASPGRAPVVDEDLADPSFSSAYQTMSPPCQFIADRVQRALQGRMTMNFKHEDQKFASRRYPSRRHTVMDGNLVAKDGLPVESLQALHSLASDELVTSALASTCMCQSSTSSDSSRDKEQVDVEGKRVFDVVVLQPFSMNNSLDATRLCSDQCLESACDSATRSVSPLNIAQHSGNMDADSYEWISSESSEAQLPEQGSACFKTSLGNFSNGLYSGGMLLCTSENEEEKKNGAPEQGQFSKSYLAGTNGQSLEKSKNETPEGPNLSKVLSDIAKPVVIT